MAERRYRPSLLPIARESNPVRVHSFPYISGQHLTPVGRQQGSKDLSFISLERLRLESLKLGNPLMVQGDLLGEISISLVYCGHELQNLILEWLHDQGNDIRELVEEMGFELLDLQ